MGMSPMIRAGVAAAVVLLFAPAAMAAVVLRFEPISGRSGDPIVGETPDASMSLVPSDRLAIFLAPSQEVADAVSSPHDERVQRFGTVTADERNIGHFEGEVPRVAPGTYVAIGWCRACGSDGVMLTVGTFRVVSSQLPVTGLRLLWLMPTALLLLSLGALLLRGSRRQGIHASTG